MALARQACSTVRSQHLFSSCFSSTNKLQSTFMQSSYNHKVNAKPWEISFDLIRRTQQHVYESLYAIKGERTFSTHVKAPPQVRQGVGLKLCLASPGVIMEPYKRPEPISFLQRWFTRKGWKRSKEDFLAEFKSAYAVAKLRKLTGYSKPKFYKEAIELYKEINSLLAGGDRTSLRKLVTENMYSIFKKEIKMRETTWSHVHWEMIGPAVKVRTLQARMIGVDKNNLDNSFVQLTLEILTNQKFAAYDLQGQLAAGDMDVKVLVRDIWVFERSLFQPDAKWRLCGRISL